MAFTSEQQVQIDRLPAERLADLVLAKLEKRSVDELRARVNIIAIGEGVEFSKESNYSAEDTALIQAVKPRSKWMIAIPQLLAEVEVLRAEGMSETTARVVLKNKF